MIRPRTWLAVLLAALLFAVGCKKATQVAPDSTTADDPAPQTSDKGTSPAPGGKSVALGTLLKPAEADFESGKKKSLRLAPRARFDERGPVPDVVAFSPDGRYLASAGSEPDVVLWDLRTGAAAHRLAVRKDPRNTTPLAALLFTPDGRSLLTTDGDKAVVVWDLAAGKPRHRLEVNNTVQRAAVSADGKTAAVLTLLGDVHLFDLNSGATLRSAAKAAEGFLGKALALSPDGKWVAVAGKKKDVVLLDGATLEARHSFDGHAHSVEAAAFAPDGKTLATVAFDDHMIKLWDLATMKEKRTIKADSGLLFCVAFSPAGTVLLTAGSDLRVWDPETGAERASARSFSGNVSAAAFSADGTAVAAVVNNDRGCFVWDVEAGRERASWAANDLAEPVPGGDGKSVLLRERDKLEFRDPETGAVRRTVTVRDPQGFGDPVVAASADGKWLAFDRGGKAVVLDLAADKEKVVLDSKAYSLRQLAFSPDGKTLAIAAGPDVQLWDVAAAKRTHDLKGHRDEARVLAFSPDGTRLACGGGDQTVRLWRVANGTLEGTLVAHETAVYRVAWSPDGKLLLTAGDTTARVWEADGGKLRHALRGHVQGVSGATFTADGKGVITYDHGGTLRLWDVETGRQRAGLETGGARVGLVPLEGGKSFVLKNKQVRVWDVETAFAQADGDKAGLFANLRQPEAEEPAVFFPAAGRLTGHPGYVRSLAYSADGKRLIALCGDKHVCVWDPAAGKLLHTFAHGVEEVLRMVVARDGSLFALACRDKTVRVWDVAAGKEKYKLTGHDQFVRCIAFAPDGKLLASGTGGFGQGEVIVWDLAAGTQQRKLARDGGTVYDVLAFSPDGKLLAAGTFGKEVRLWEAGTWKALAPLKADDSVSCLAFSGDGTRLAAGGGLGNIGNFDLGIWELPQGKRLDTLAGHRRSVTGLAMTPDGRLLFSSAFNLYGGETHVWDLEAGKQIALVAGQPPQAVAPDGRFLAGETSDRAILLRDTTPLRDAALQKSLQPFLAARAAVRLDGDTLQIDLKANGPDSIAALAAVAKIPRPVELNLSDSYNLGDDGLALLASATNLRGLTLSGCTGVTSAGLKLLAGLKELKALDLTGIQGSAAALEHLRGLEKLTVLRLGRTGVTVAELKHLETFKALFSLDLDGNPISDDAVDALLKVANLEELDLSNTEVTAGGIEKLKGLPKLRWLSLAGLMLEGGWDILAELKGLQALVLVSTDIRDRELKAVGALEKLTTLYLGGTTMTGEGFEHLAGLKMLSELSLDQMKGFQGANLRHLKGVTTLTALNLSQTRIDDAGLAGLKDWDHLQKLKPPRGTTDKGVKTIAELKGLTELDLDDLGGLTDAGLESLKGLTKLESLRLMRTKVSDAGLAHLKGIKTLRRLNVGVTQVTDKGVDDLKQAIPELQVER